MSVSIQCPQCLTELKLKDRSLLGRKGKCAKCGHKFVLCESTIEPAESTLPTAEPSNPFAFLDIVTGQQHEPFESGLQSDAFESRERSPSNLPAFADISVSTDGMSELKVRRTRTAKRRNATLIATVVIGVVAVLIAAVFQFSGGKNDVAKNPVVEHQPEVGKVTEEDGEGLFDPAETEYALRGRPTHGQPIEMTCIPFGAQLILNLHPAQIWNPDNSERLSLCVPPLAKLIENALEELFQAKPEQVDEILICLIPGVRGTDPDIAAVARLTDASHAAQLVEKFGTPVTSYRRPVYVVGKRSYIRLDSKTVAVCPEKQADEMIAAVEKPHPSEQLDPLLAMTDRDRLLTAVFTPQTLKLQETWISDRVTPLINHLIEELGDQTESVSCSVHLANSLFHSEILLYEKRGSIKKFEQQMRSKLESLAEKLVSLTEKMDPQEAGERQLIGRFPAMVEVFSMATIVERGSRHVRLMTPLPAIAGPNLFAAGYLTWDESTRTDFSESHVASIGTSQASSSLADRLKKRIDVDFRGTPLSEAFDIIGGEIGVSVEIDGDALKAGGFTKNLKQTIQMDAAPVYDVVLKIFQESKTVEGNPEKQLVLVVDESNQKLIVTTLTATDKKGQVPFVSKP